MENSVSVSELMHESGVAFGTSGARGLVTAMSDRVCYGYTAGFLQHLQDQGAWQVGGTVLLAGDLRPTTPRIIAACSAAVRALGGEPIYCGWVPTPALAYHAMGLEIPAVMVTGSHIPDDRNGIKFYRPDGEILKHDEPKILGQMIEGCAWDKSGAIAGLSDLPAPLDIVPGYVARYVAFFGSDALAGCRVGVYQHSAVGRDILVDILAAMGADVVPLGRSETFVPVDTEAVEPEHIDIAKQWSVEYHLDAIVTTDGDSDRPLVADEHGEWLRGDVVAMLCAAELGMATVVTPVSSNSMAERCGLFQRVERTRIGSPFVIEAMNEAIARGEGLVCGYEANGGFLLGSDVVRAGARLTALPTRDAALPIIAVLIAGRDSTLRGLVNALPRIITHSDRIQDFLPERRDALMGWLIDEEAERDARMDAEFGPIAMGRLTSINLTDGVRMNFSNGRVIHLRGSGNAPELRCYVEAESAEIAKRLAHETLALVVLRF